MFQLDLRCNKVVSPDIRKLKQAQKGHEFMAFHVGVAFSSAPESFAPGREGRFSGKGRRNRKLFKWLLSIGVEQD
ncbi:hypothetical protein TNCV_1029721 [Trichonephila clavipes]|nr:hypothetical protein TNCV_1029721 [Trichonephila clavipes]